MTPVAIVGVGESRVGRLRGMSALRLTLEAARAAIQDAGGSAAAIDGVLTRNFDMDVTYMHSQLVAQHLGRQPRFTTDINLGGATAIAMLEQAALLLTTGVCQLVLCAYGENRRTSWAVPRHGRIRMGNEDFEACYGLTWGMGPHALAAQRHMHVFGTTSRQLGMIAVAQRRYASQNPNADLGTPLRLEEYERAPCLIAPLRKYDLAYLFDGGAAVVLAALPWTRDHTACPVPILGLGQAHSGDHLAYCAAMVASTTTPARRSGEEAFWTKVRPCFKEGTHVEMWKCHTIGPQGRSYLSLVRSHRYFGKAVAGSVCSFNSATIAGPSVFHRAPSVVAVSGL